MSGRPQRATHYTPRRRKPTAEQEPAIRALAAAKIPHPLASEFGVNHETIRTVLCQREPSVIVWADNASPQEHLVPRAASSPLSGASGEWL